MLFLATPVAYTFTGAACNTSAMLTQIPAATTPVSYCVNSRTEHPREATEGTAGTSIGVFFAIPFYRVYV